MTSNDVKKHAVNQTNWTAVIDQSNEHAALKLHQSNNNIQVQHEQKRQITLNYSEDKLA